MPENWGAVTSILILDDCRFLFILTGWQNLMQSWDTCDLKRYFSFLLFSSFFFSLLEDAPRKTKSKITFAFAALDAKHLVTHPSSTHTAHPNKSKVSTPSWAFSTLFKSLSWAKNVVSLPSSYQPPSLWSFTPEALTLDAMRRGWGMGVNSAQLSGKDPRQQRTTLLVWAV